MSKFSLKFKKYETEEEQLWETINVSSTSTFLTSINWIKFQKSLGKEIDQYLIYLIINNKDYLIGNLYIEIHRRKIANYAYAPYGPVLNIKDIEELTQDNHIDLLEECYFQIKQFQKEYIKKKNLNLFRIDPLITRNYLKIFEKLGYKKSLAPAQAKDVWQIDIDQDIEAIRSGMSKSTRYNINKTSRMDLKIVKADNAQLIKEFSILMNNTTERKSFSNYDYDYFKKQYDLLNKEGMSNIYLVEYKGKYLAGALINYYKETAYYTHGCSTSDPVLMKIRAPYFLQWSIILEAKSMGFNKYNMWGILPEDALVGASEHSNHELVQHSHSNNPLKGVSDFKQSFGGYEINYIGAQDVFISVKYYLQRLTDWWVYRHDRY